MRRRVAGGEDGGDVAAAASSGVAQQRRQQQPQQQLRQSTEERFAAIVDSIAATLAVDMPKYVDLRAVLALTLEALNAVHVEAARDYAPARRVLMQLREVRWLELMAMPFESRQASILRAPCDVGCFDNVRRLSLVSVEPRTRIAHFEAFKRQVQRMQIACGADSFAWLTEMAEPPWNALLALDVSGDRIERVDPRLALAAPNLTELDLSNNLIASLGGLRGLPLLSVVSLNANRILSFAEVARTLPQVRILHIRGNNLENLAEIGSMHNLSELDVSENRIASVGDVLDVGVLRSLESLRLLGNPIARRPQYRGEVLSCFPSSRRSGIGLDGVLPSADDMKRAAAAERDRERERKGARVTVHATTVGWPKVNDQLGIVQLSEPLARRKRARRLRIYDNVRQMLAEEAERALSMLDGARDEAGASTAPDGAGAAKMQQAPRSAALLGAHLQRKAEELRRLHGVEWLSHFQAYLRTIGVQPKPLPSAGAASVLASSARASLRVPEVPVEAARAVQRSHSAGNLGVLHTAMPAPVPVWQPEATSSHVGAPHARAVPPSDLHASAASSVSSTSVGSRISYDVDEAALLRVSGDAQQGVPVAPLAAGARDDVPGGSGALPAAGAAAASPAPTRGDELAHASPGRAAAGDDEEAAYVHVLGTELRQMYGMVQAGSRRTQVVVRGTPASSEARGPGVDAAVAGAGSVEELRADGDGRRRARPKSEYVRRALPLEGAGGDEFGGAGVTANAQPGTDAARLRSVGDQEVARSGVTRAIQADDAAEPASLATPAAAGTGLTGDTLRLFGTWFGVQGALTSTERVLMTFCATALLWRDAPTTERPVAVALTDKRLYITSVIDGVSEAAPAFRHWARVARESIRRVLVSLDDQYVRLEWDGGLLDSAARFAPGGARPSGSQMVLVVRCSELCKELYLALVLGQQPPPELVQCSASSHVALDEALGSVRVGTDGAVLSHVFVARAEVPPVHWASGVAPPTAVCCTQTHIVQLTEQYSEHPCVDDGSDDAAARARRAPPQFEVLRSQPLQYIGSVRRCGAAGCLAVVVFAPPDALSASHGARGGAPRVAEWPLLFASARECDRFVRELGVVWSAEFDGVPLVVTQHDAEFAPGASD